MLAARYRKCVSLALVFCSVILRLGCGTLANGRGWGQDATLSPGWEQVGKAALNAALEPET
jgi:membrane-associated phospholipid phosphatase